MKFIKKKLKGSVVVEATYVTITCVIVVFICLMLLVLEFRDSISITEFTVDQNSYNGIGEDVRYSYTDDTSFDADDVMVNVATAKVNDSFDAEIKETLYDEVLFSDKIKIYFRGFKEKNWYIARERLRSIYK